MRAWLARRPLLVSLLLAAAAVAAAGLLVLPRLDGVEVASWERTGEAAGLTRVAVRVRYRLASAAGGRIVVRAPAPAGGPDDDRVEARVEAGLGIAELVLKVPDREAFPLVAQLLPDAPPGGLLERLQAGRRRSLAVVDRPRP